MAIQLEYYDREKENYLRLTEDVGPVAEDQFILTETTKVRAYVGVYPGCNCDVIARPALYQEGE